MLFQRSLEWLEKEKALGSPFPERMVLATTGLNGQAHSRVVAIKEITAQGYLFFTQRWSRKARELQNNPYASATIWLPLQQREIIIEGSIQPLNEEQNERYWEQLPRSRQLTYASFAQSSEQVIASNDILKATFRELDQLYPDGVIPRGECYCGYLLQPKTLYFYTLHHDSFSEYRRAQLVNGHWQEQLLSP